MMTNVSATSDNTGDWYRMLADQIEVIADSVMLSCPCGIEGRERERLREIAQKVRELEMAVRYGLTNAPSLLHRQPGG